MKKTLNDKNIRTDNRSGNDNRQDHDNTFVAASKIITIDYML